MYEEKLKSNPIFIRALSKALVLGHDYSGEVSMEAWEKAVERNGAWRNSLLARLFGLGGNGRGNNGSRRNAENTVTSCNPSLRGDNMNQVDTLSYNLIDTVLHLEESSRRAIMEFFLSRVPLSEVAEFYAKPYNWAEARLEKSLNKVRAGLDARYHNDRKQWCSAMTPLVIEEEG